MARFGFRGILSDVDVSTLVATQPRLRRFRERLEAQGVRPHRAQTLMERLVISALDDFGTHYEGHLSHHIDEIVRIREEISTRYERVLELSPESPLPPDLQANDLQRLFRDLEEHLNAVSGRSPTQHLDQAGNIATPHVEGVLREPEIITPPQAVPPSPARPASATTREAALASALSEQAEALQDFAVETRDVVGRAAELAPDALRRAVRAEEQETLNRSLGQIASRMRDEGASDVDISRLRQGLEELNARHRAAAVDRLLLAAAVGRIFDSRLRQEVGQALEANQFVLPMLAHENPARLLELWKAWEEGRSRSGKSRLRSRDFETYVRRRQSEPRGQRGEFGAASQLGENFALLKSPDYNVNLPGTDLVVVNLHTFEVLIIDNKAWRREEVGSAGALTRNIVNNLRDDVRAFTAAFPPGADVPLQIHAAVNRLERALQDLDAVFGPGQVPTTLAVQQRISQILADHNIRRVVTGAGGEVERVRVDLERAGVTFEPLE